MSSILRALKKLEDETARQIDFPRWPKTIDNIKAVNKSVKRAWLSSRSFLIFFVAVIIGFFGWVLLHERQHIIKAPSPEIISSRPAEKVKEEDTVSPLETNTRNTKPVIETTSDLLQKKLKKQGVLSKDTSNFKNGSYANKSINEEPKPAVSKQSDTFGQLIDSHLELQAIAWSFDPGERIAVINGKIVREGDSIQGFSIVRISSEFVVVKRGARERKLIFKLN
ncbi:MAG: general secretion pathway protein GspB [Thermodesulfobacteriota bacterium]|nr:general secretion pathway protein GspB [Thermodesulfobacteriota bacterium]